MSLLLAVALLMQEPGAEATFRRLEESLGNAKTLKAKFALETTVADARSGVEKTTRSFGTLLLNRSDKLCFFVSQDTPKGPAGMFVHLEPPRVTENLIHRNVISIDARSLRADLVRAFGRSGTEGVLDWLEDSGDLQARRTICNYPLPEKTAEGKDLAMVEVGDFRTGEQTPKGMTLLYTATHKTSGESCTITLVYDPRSLHPKQRTLTRKKGDISTVVVESYTEFEINGELPDLVFWEAFGESPEAILLRKIEQSIDRANTVQLKFSGEVILKWEGGERKGRVTGELLLKGASKLRMIAEVDAAGQGKETTTEVCDGVRCFGSGLSSSRAKEPGKVIGNYLRGALARTGILAGGFLAGEGMNREDFDMKETFSVYNVQEGATEKESKSLTYTLSHSGDNAEVQLWYDPKDLRLLKRVLKVKAGGPGSTFTETYDSFTLNSDIPDEKFKLPEDKK
jgi:outer membrane lipoprotein-sorting protein